MFRQVGMFVQKMRDIGRIIYGIVLLDVVQLSTIIKYTRKPIASGYGCPRIKFTTDFTSVMTMINFLERVTHYVGQDFYYTKTDCLQFND